jgi:hypothetical protein
MRLPRRALASTAALAFLCACVSILPQVSGPAFIHGLTVHNASSQGGSGKTYRLAPGLDAVPAERPYVDRAASGPLSMPPLLRGQTFIRTADGDRAAAPGSSDFLSFEVVQSSTVYVAHDTRIAPKPHWQLHGHGHATSGRRGRLRALQ